MSKFILFLSDKGVTPNFVTSIGIAFLLVACSLPQQYYLITCALILLFMLMDAIDGGLARHTKSNHMGGSIMDMWADHLGVIFIPAAAIFHLSSNGISAVLFSNGYVIFVVLMAFMNEQKIQNLWAFRVKYFLYAIYVIALGLNQDIMTWFLSLFAVYYWLVVVISLNKVYQHYHQS